MMGVSDFLVRISVGLEDELELIQDFTQALDTVTAIRNPS